MTRLLRYAGALLAVSLVAGGGYATADSLITSAKIADGTIRCKDLHKGLCAKLKLAGKSGPAGAAGAKGDTGAQGAAGAKGDTGARGQSGPQGAPGEPGKDAVRVVTKLLSDSTGNGVPAPAWAERGSTCGSGAPGDADVNSGRLRFSLDDAAGLKTVSATFTGYNDLRLKDISHVSYHAKYEQDGTDQHGGTPYFRILTKNNAHSIIYSPNTQPGAVINAGEWQEFVVTKGTVRYDDDAGFGADIVWQDLVKQFGDEKISQIRLSAGCAGGYSAKTVAEADNLTVVADGQKSVFDFGS